jgi:hypothetical protein
VGKEYKILDNKPNEKRPFRGPRGRCKDNIKMSLEEMG